MIIYILAVVVGVGLLILLIALQRGATKKAVAAGIAKQRPTFFYKKRYVFQCPLGTEFTPIVNALNNDALNLHKIQCSKRQGYNLLDFNYGDVACTFSAVFRSFTSKQEPDACMFDFQLQSWRGQYGELSGHASLAANVLLTSLEQAILAQAPGAKVLELNERLKVETPIL